MKNLLRIGGGLLLLVLLTVFNLFINGSFGISQGQIEADARRSQKIPDTWQVAADTSDAMSAMVFYPEDLSESTFSIYVNRGGVSFGYFFRSGGGVAAIDSSVATFSIENCPDFALLSMNRPQISCIELHGGSEIGRISVDPEKPFALVLPGDGSNVTLYDTAGAVVEPAW